MSNEYFQTLLSTAEKYGAFLFAQKKFSSMRFLNSQAYQPKLSVKSTVVQFKRS